MLRLEIANPYLIPQPVRFSFSEEDSFFHTSTRCYDCDVAGPRSKALSFLRKLLLNAPVERMWVNAPPALVSFRCLVDISIRAGHLDLEQEYILRFCRHVSPSGPLIRNIKPRQRVYLLGGTPSAIPKIVRHLVNPVIHDWTVVYG